MNRMTIRYPDGTVELKCSVDDAVMQLATYEDTDLEPEEIETLNRRLDENIGFSRLWQGRYFNLLAGEQHTTTQHIADLLQAESEGRLIVLPCKVGDTVYIIVGTHIYSGKITHYWIDEGGLSVSCIYNSFGMCMYSGEFGKTVFLTREEADAAMGGDAT